MTPGHFSLEGFEESFPGWSNGSTWNGWETPAFAPATLEKIRDALQAIDGYPSLASTDGDDGEWWCEVSDDGERHPLDRVMIGEQVAYRLDGWCWLAAEME